MKERIAIVTGLRTPMGKAGGALKDLGADDLGARIVKEVLERSPLNASDIDEVIMGNVAQPSNAANIARVVALKAGLPISIPAYTVHRNCASGMESITSAAAKLMTGEAKVIIAGGTESMSNIPFLYSKAMVALFTELGKAKTLSKKLAVLSRFRPSHLKPIIGVVEGLTDPVCGQIMGITAENLSREFGITREAQDAFALNSHKKTCAAQEKGLFNDEIVPIPTGPKLDIMHTEDEGPRKDQSLAALAKLSPYFDRKRGTVTVGNACPLTDGAAAVLLMMESHAKRLGLKPLGYLNSFAYAGLEPHRMGLGPVYAAAKVLKLSGYKMSDFDLVEINEAFAAQVIANEIAFSSDQFAQTFLNQSKAVGAIDPQQLNVNGGAIALGHPVGMTGTRLVITQLLELQRRKRFRGLATLCVGGGQGAALVLETM